MKRFLARVSGLILLYRLLFSGYSNTGPFTNNVTPPGISATFLNNVENFLDTVNSLATDSHNTSDGNGNATVVSMTFAHGKIMRIAFGFTAVTTGGTTVTHNLGVNPSAILITPSNNVITWASSTVTTTTFTAFVSSNTNVWWLAIA